ncbi:MAG TPA: DUF1326 domain-containing protein [Pirellulales bacterium]|nr:DUF1326 domain-containing protein [Pirellulales bacterium]
MSRLLGIFCAAVSLVFAEFSTAGELKGDYLETRTCDVYTGPCFANGQGGLTGKDAIMAWSIDRGSYENVDLAGLKVVVVLNASDTLGFGGTLVNHPDPIKSVIIVDSQATPQQHDALVQFAQQYAKHAGQVVKVVSAPIEMALDHFTAAAALTAGDYAHIATRKLHSGDCVCSNEATFYPPLCDVRNAVAAFTVEGRYSGPGLGTHWSNPSTRSAFLASFSY